VTERGVTESVVEQAALAWLESLGWLVKHGPEIAPDMPGAERRDYGEVVLAQRLRDALARLNPELPRETHCCPSSSPARCGSRTPRGSSGELHE